MNLFHRIIKGEKPASEQIGLQKLKEFERLNFSGEQDIRKILKNWEVGEAKSLAGVHAMLIKKTEKQAVFLEAIPPGISFRLHWHLKGQDEVLTVLLGEVLTGLTEPFILKQNEAVSYLGGRKNLHSPGNGSPVDIAIILVTINFTEP